MDLLGVVLAVVLLPAHGLVEVLDHAELPVSGLLGDLWSVEPVTVSVAILSLDIFRKMLAGMSEVFKVEKLDPDA